MEKQIIKTLTYRNGDPIRTDFEQAGKDSQGAVKVVNYNYYYNWYAVNDPRGLAPEGYEVPGIDEIEKIDSKYFDMTGYVDTTGYDSKNSLLFKSGENRYWWTADDYDASSSFSKLMQYQISVDRLVNSRKEYGFSVLCVKKQLKNNKMDEILREEELKAYSNYHQVVGDNIEKEKNRYYGSGATEAIKVIEDWGLGFSLGNAVKYIARAGKKTPDKIKDLKKALWYIEREIKNEMDLFNKTIG